MKIIKKVFHFLNNNYLKLRGINIKKGYITKLTGVNFGEYKNIYFNGDIFVNKFCSILAGKQSKIIFGNGILIGPGVIITSSNHSIKIEDKLFDNIWDEKDIIIEDEVWIGGNSTILPGVKIPKGCIIGAGSVVIKSIEKEYSIVGGIPAKIIKFRS